MNEKTGILLVDEERDLVKILSIVLRQHGFEVKTAISASTALECYYREFFDVLVIELNMSEMSGIKLINKIRAINPEQKIIAISVHPLGCRFWDSRQISIPFEDGFPGTADIECLDKPFKLKSLLDLLRKISSQDPSLEGSVVEESSRWRKVRALLE